jgi:hypothetical protein
MDFDVGSRGWCYILERHGLRKGEFGAAEKLIADCRKSGALPLDICAEDESRRAVGLQQLNDSDIEAEAAGWIDYLTNDAHKTYTPVSFWDDQKFYVETAVEKLDLRNLFEPPCAEFYVPIQNFKGWSDLNARAAMMRRFAEHDHSKKYVQDYIARFGVRKCEANALVVVPEIGRKLCRDAILEFIPADTPARYCRKLDRERAKLRQMIRRKMGAL